MLDATLLADTLDEVLDEVLDDDRVAEDRDVLDDDKLSDTDDVLLLDDDGLGPQQAIDATNSGSTPSMSEWAPTSRARTYIDGIAMPFGSTMYTGSRSRNPLPYHC